MRHFAVHHLVRWGGILGAVTLFSDPAACETQSAQVPVGPRAIAMGGAYSAIADDGSAVFWNPAGLPLIGHQEITGAHANLFGTGINDNYLSFVLPLSTNHTAAIDWYHSGFDNGVLRFGENRVDLAYAQRIRPWLLLGATGKWLDRGTDLDGASVRRGHGLGADFGLLTFPIAGLRLGVAVQDAFNTKIHYDQGSTAEVYSRNVRLGSAYSLGKRAIVAFDVDDRWHGGLELRPLPQLALRVGTEADRRNSEGNTWEYGAGFKVGMFRADYARVQAPTLGSTDHFAFSMDFNFNAAQVRIEKVTPREIYASLYRSYESDTAAVVDLFNVGDEVIHADVRLNVPDLMDGSSRPVPVDLRPGVSTRIILPGNFSKKAMKIASDSPARFEVVVESQGRRLPRTERKASQGHVYAPGAINWGDGVAQAAAYVTVHDEAIDSLAGRVGHTIGQLVGDPNVRSGFGLRFSPNLAYAAGLVDAMGLLGITYVPDPRNPYSVVSGRVHAVDNVNYPFQTLEKRAGDCDDTSVLLAALLENLNIPTCLVSVPGHLYVLFGTGIPESYRDVLGASDEMCVVKDGEVWIPIETTALGKGFSEAWRLGAESYQESKKRNEVQLVDVQEAQRQYPTGALPGARPIIAFDSRPLQSMLTQEATALTTWRDQAWQAQYSRQPDSVLYRARFDLLSGNLDAARVRLEKLLSDQPSSARLHNNLAVVLASEGNIESALAHCASALDADSSDAGTWLNVGLLLAFAGDTLESREVLSEAVDLAGGYDAALRRLGLLPREEVGRGERREATMLRVKAALKRRDASPGSMPAPSGNRIAVAPRAVVARLNDRVRTLMLRPARTRSAPRDQEEASAYLYWKR